MAQLSREQKLKELTEWMEAFSLSVQDASKQLGVTEEVLISVQNGKSMPRPMWNELKTRFDYKQCFGDKKTKPKDPEPSEQEKREPDKVISVGKESAVILQTTQMTFSFAVDITSLRRSCKKWLDKHPDCKSKDLIGTVEAMLQDMFA